MVGNVSVFIDHLRFDDVEDLFRIYVTTMRAFAFVEVDVIDEAFEVDNAFNRIAVVNWVTTLIEQKEFIEHLEDVA